jgi:hypothetical protein
MHPIPQISTGNEYIRLPNKTSGGRYQLPAMPILIKQNIMNKIKQGNNFVRVASDWNGIHPYKAEYFKSHFIK